MKSKIPQIGRRGWLGITLVIFGMFWFINARSAAEESGKQVWASGSGNYAELTGLAKAAGYDSYYDFLVNQNHTHSLGLIGFGTALVVSGYWKYGRKRCRTVG
jgi:drug/metabolite transporter (DMT)-like permease